MEEQLLRILIPVIGLVSGLIGAFVGLQNRALLAEVRKELAELEGISASAVTQRAIRDGLDVLVLASASLKGVR